MPTKDHQARAFALAIASIRSDAEALDNAPLYCDLADRKTYRHVDHLPRKEYRLPAPGNPRGMIVSAPAARDSLNALADRLEKGARAFGGTPPRRDRSPLNTRGIVAARNAHAEGHRNAAHRAIGARLFIAASGSPFAVVSQMQAAGHDVLLCRSIAARSNTIIAFCARSGVRLATAGNASAPADFNEFCAWLDSKAADYSGKLESMASLDQAAAVADYLDGDTVEAIDPEAEPCDTAAAIARAEATAAPEPEPEPEPSPCDATDAPADPAETATPASADACKAGDTAGEKLASPQAVRPRARLFQPPARMAVPRGQIHAAEVKTRMPGTPPADETQAASRSRPRAGETSRTQQACRHTMRRRKALSLPPRRSIPLRARRRCARRRHVPPRKAWADDEPHYISANKRPPPSLPAKRWTLTAPGPAWQSWHPCRQKAGRAAGES